MGVVPENRLILGDYMMAPTTSPSSWFYITYYTHAYEHFFFLVLNAKKKIKWERRKGISNCWWFVHFRPFSHFACGNFIILYLHFVYDWNMFGWNNSTVAPPFRCSQFSISLFINLSFKWNTLYMQTEFNKHKTFSKDVSFTGTKGSRKISLFTTALVDWPCAFHTE